jgi:hypothetical protein
MAKVMDTLSAKEQAIVLGAMRATASHIDESEIPTRLGVDVDELARIISQWPIVDVGDQSGAGFLAVHNSLNEVCHGFRIEPSEWARWFDVPIDEVIAVYQRWLILANVRGGIR